MNNEQFLQLTAQLSDMMVLLKSIQEQNQELKNDNALLREENEYLKRKLFINMLLEIQ